MVEAVNLTYVPKHAALTHCEAMRKWRGVKFMFAGDTARVWIMKKGCGEKLKVAAYVYMGECFLRSLG